MKSILYMKFRQLTTELNQFPFEHGQFITRMSEGVPAYVDIDMGQITSLTPSQERFIGEIEGVSVRVVEV